MSYLNDLNSDYGIKYQGLLTQYLRMEVKQTETYITVCQEQYAKEILRKFWYGKAHTVGNPMEVDMRLSGDDTNNKQTGDTKFPYSEAFGMLMYLATSTRPDLAFVVVQLSRFVAHPHTKHIGTLKRSLPNVAGTSRNNITYARQNHDKMNNNTMHIVI